MKIQNVNELKKYIGKTLYIISISGGIAGVEVTGYAFEVNNGKKRMLILTGNYNRHEPAEVVSRVPRKIVNYYYKTFDEKVAKRLAKKIEKEHERLEKEEYIEEAKGLLDQAGVKYEIFS